MNTTWIRAMVGMGVLGLLAAPLSAQNVRIGVSAHLSDRAVARVSVGTDSRSRIAFRYGEYGPWARGYRGRAWARHQREVDRITREHERLHRQLLRMPPGQRARVHREWHRRVIRRHGHSHPEWEHGRGVFRRDGGRGNLRPVQR